MLVRYSKCLLSLILCVPMINAISNWVIPVTEAFKRVGCVPDMDFVKKELVKLHGMSHSEVIEKIGTILGCSVERLLYNAYLNRFCVELLRTPMLYVSDGKLKCSESEDVWDDYSDYGDCDAHRNYVTQKRLPHAHLRGCKSVDNCLDYWLCPICFSKVGLLEKSEEFGGYIATVKGVELVLANCGLAKLILAHLACMNHEELSKAQGLYIFQGKLWSLSTTK